MKRLSLFAILVSTISCSSTAPENTSASQIPEAMQCPSSADPAQGCPSTVNPVAPLKAISEVGNPKAKAREKVGELISGRCEMKVTGEAKVRPCTEVDLVLTSPTNTHRALFDGFTFQVPDVAPGSYKVVASAEGYELSPNKTQIKAGQVVHLRINAKPKP